MYRPALSWLQAVGLAGSPRPFLSHGLEADSEGGLSAAASERFGRRSPGFTQLPCPSQWGSGAQAPHGLRLPALHPIPPPARPPSFQASVLSRRVVLPAARLSFLPLGTSTLPAAQTLLPSELSSFSLKPGRVCRAPEARRVATPGLSTKCRVASLPHEQGRLTSLKGAFQ